MIVEARRQFDAARLLIPAHISNLPIPKVLIPKVRVNLKHYTRGERLKMVYMLLGPSDLTHDVLTTDEIEKRYELTTNAFRNWRTPEKMMKYNNVVLADPDPPSLTKSLLIDELKDEMLFRVKAVWLACGSMYLPQGYWTEMVEYYQDKILE